jgi:hypothetical protein
MLPLGGRKIKDEEDLTLAIQPVNRSLGGAAPAAPEGGVAGCHGTAPTRGARQERRRRGIAVRR